MPKTPSDELLESIAEDFHTYLRRGVRFEQVIGSAHPELNIDDLETLLRIHFVLTDAKNEDQDVGVLDFIRKLEDQIRRMKTTTTPESVRRHGEVRGHIDWQQTVKARSRTGRLNEPIFVSRQQEEYYNIDENLVLKRLLSIIQEIVFDDLSHALENPGAYGWLEMWTDTEAVLAPRDSESAAEMLKRVLEQNIYLQRINAQDRELTDRTIESVKQSRSVFYQEAAILLDRYRQLMQHELDSAEAREILNHTIIAPDQTEVLFELYWIFRLLDAYENVQYRVLTDQRAHPSVIAAWESEGARYRVSHDSTGTGLTFYESIGSESIEPDGYLYRLNEVLSRWRELSEEMLDRGGESTLWGGRPDIIVERYEQDKGTWLLDEIFIGEVKYTKNLDYVASGLRELLEYMAFVREGNSEGDYVESSENLLNSVRVKGLLFTDDLDQEIPTSDEIRIVQYPESLKQVV